MSVVVLMRGCSGTDEYEAEKKKKRKKKHNHSQYTHYKKLDYTTGHDGQLRGIMQLFIYNQRYE